MPSIKGTASVSDSRAREKALKKTKFPRSFGKSVSLEKVNKSVLEQWIEQKVTLILGFEDEIVSSTAINLFLPSDNSTPDPKKAQLDLAGFLGEQAVSFSSELWKLMLEAQAHPSGIPQTLLEAKKKEMTEKMERENQSRQQNMHPSGGRNPRQFGNGLPPKRLGPPIQHDGKNSASGNARGDPQQNPRDKQQGPSAEVPANGTDQFGRAYPPQRSRNAQRPNPRDQYDRRPSDFEGSRRGQRRSRSRDRYDHDRDRDYRRRSENWNRGMNNYDSRRPDDRRYDSNRRDDRSGYHRQYDRRRDYRDHDRYRDGDGRRHRHPATDYDRVELDNLERRLVHLKQQFSGRDNKHDSRTMHRIDQEIRDVQDRIYEVERRRRRYDSSRDNYSRGRTRRSRSRSPSYEHRRGGSRRRRSNSTASERSASTQRSKDDYSTDSGGSDRGSHSSYSPSPERSKRNKGKGSPKRQRRRRSRSYSSSEGSEQSK